MLFKLALIVAKYLGYFWKKISCKELKKLPNLDTLDADPFKWISLNFKLNETPSV